jgi:hypothetical protein
LAANVGEILAQVYCGYEFNDQFAQWLVPLGVVGVAAE